MKDRRSFLRASTLAGSGIFLAARIKSSDKDEEKGEQKDKKGGEVTATEDLS